jgi:phosphoenolpyruvate carboxykinase (ATP)
MATSCSLEQYGIHCDTVLRNAAPALLYEEAIEHERGTAIADNGALIVRSGKRTGRSPRDKRLVQHSDSQESIWWGEINIPLDEHTFMINRQRAVDCLATCDRLYVVDGYAGWDQEHRLKVRLISSRAYHALFLHNLLIHPSAEELELFGEPDYVIYNAGRFPANKYTMKVTSSTSVDFSIERKEIVILGSEYAGEMKKGIFTIVNYLMPERSVLSMHCAANEGPEGDVTLFFGLSGTGKTSLSADPRRRLIGDDEHCWTDSGIFNIEGGCYAKCINLERENEPEIWGAIRFGAVLENVVFDPVSREIDYSSSEITENTRACYPLEYVANARIPGIGGHPQNIVFLTCDAFGVLPPVARLTAEQAMYHFVSGYTAKVAGTEEGVQEPEATFSACFGAAFLVRHPSVYAHLLRDRIRSGGARVWLVNTGWSGGPYGTGARISIGHTRAIIDAIHSGDLARAPSVRDALFGFEVVTACPGVPREILIPRNTWRDTADYDRNARELADLFVENFEQFLTGNASEMGLTDIVAAGPPARVRPTSGR